MLIHTVGPWHTLCQFHIRGYFQQNKSHQNEKVEFWNLAMLTTQLMTMIQSREDQRVQRECHWSVPSPARTKAIKHQMSKRRKIDKVIKHQMTELGKMNNAKHSGLLFDFLTCLVQLSDKLQILSCAVDVGGVFGRNLSVLHLDSVGSF